MSDEQKPIPEDIWLQPGNPADVDEDPPSHYPADAEITWCEEAIEAGDTRYIRYDIHKREIARAQNTFGCSTLSKAELEKAAMILITLPASHPRMDLSALRNVIPPQCLVGFMKPGESICALSEDEMRDHGWVRCMDNAKPSGGTSAPETGLAVPMIEVTGGAYEGREGLVIEHKDGRIVITGWYEGGCVLAVEVSMPVDEFMRRLHLPNVRGEGPERKDGEHEQSE